MTILEMKIVNNPEKQSHLKKPMERSVYPGTSRNQSEIKRNKGCIAYNPQWIEWRSAEQAARLKQLEYQPGMSTPI
ncbi:hypothetical protein [Paenibacillus sp. FSL F4-0100]|uniref:hypothetical protein n=1 Tax=Paenibacillus TaxID=44249 RepID=UPI0030EB5F97